MPLHQAEFTSQSLHNLSNNQPHFAWNPATENARLKTTTFMRLAQTTPSCVHPNLQHMQHDPLLKPTQLLKNITKRSEGKAEVQFPHTHTLLTYILEGGGGCKWLVEGLVWKVWTLGPNEKVEECSNLETEWAIRVSLAPLLHPSTSCTLSTCLSHGLHVKAKFEGWGNLSSKQEVPYLCFQQHPHTAILDQACLQMV